MGGWAEIQNSELNQERITDLPTFNVQTTGWEGGRKSEMRNSKSEIPNPVDLPTTI
jgi:hypothetical protein